MGSNLDFFYVESPEAGSKSVSWRMRLFEDLSRYIITWIFHLGLSFFFLVATADGWTTFTIFFSSVDTPFSGFKFWPSGWKNFTVITHHKRDWCSAHVPGYLCRYRMRLTVFHKHFLPQMWKLYQEDFARTLRILPSNQQILWSYYCFGVDRQRRHMKNA